MLDLIQGLLPAIVHQDKTTTELLHYNGIVINNSNSIMRTIILNIKPGQDMFKNTRQVTQDINTNIEGLAVITEEMMATIGDQRQITWLTYGDKQIDDMNHFFISFQ